MKRPFSDQFLLGYSHEHVYYEVHVFFAMMEILTEPFLLGVEKIEDVTWIHNALTESFVIHLRNLIDFIYSDTQGQPTW